MNCFKFKLFKKEISNLQSKKLKNSKFDRLQKGLVMWLRGQRWC